MEITTFKRKDQDQWEIISNSLYNKLVDAANDEILRIGKFYLDLSVELEKAKVKNVELLEEIRKLNQEKSINVIAIELKQDSFAYSHPDKMLIGIKFNER